MEYSENEPPKINQNDITKEDVDIIIGCLRRTEDNTFWVKWVIICLLGFALIQFLNSLF